MKILLIHPPALNTITTNCPKVIEEEIDLLPPLGIMYIAAYLEKYTPHRVKILDCQAEKLNYSQLKTRLAEENPDIVGITVLTFTLIDAFKTIEVVKEVNQNTKVILGGVHVYIYPEETMENPNVDYLVLGEGEKTFKDLVDNISDRRNLYKIRGIVFREGTKIINTGPGELIQDLDNLPFPARHLTPYKIYRSSLAKKFPITTMITSRGCPFKCLFCLRPHFGKILRTRSARNVADEIEECKKMGINEIFIYDDTFTVMRQRVMDICNEIKKRKIDISWDIRTRIDTVDEELLKEMKSAGCQRIHYGIEAGTQKILNILRKGITLEKAEAVIKMTRKIGIQTLAYFMIGSPEETKEDILKTFEFAKKINPDFVQIAITLPYPATDLYRLGLEKKIFPDFWGEFVKKPSPDFQPRFWEENLNKNELTNLLTVGYKSFYLRPSYIIQKIAQIRSWEEFKTKIGTGLAILKI